MPEIDKNKISKEVKEKYSVISNSFRLVDIKNPELDKYNNAPKDLITTEVGDVKQQEFYPQVKLGRWGNSENDNEVNFSVRLKDTEYEKAEISTLQDKIIWDKGNIKIEYFDYAEGEGGYKMIPYLKAKPDTNKIVFSVQRKGLKFFKQRPLTEEITQEQKDKGWTATETEIKDEKGNVVVKRPIDIVNSFVIYHDTKGGMNDKDGKEYKVGKAFHDKRPHFYDAEGNEAWGDIDYVWNGDVGERIVTIPQDFLDKAVYPIKSNDTFGYTTIGTFSQSGISNKICASKYSLSEGASVSSMTFYHDGGVGGTAKLAIYNEDLSFVAGTEEISIEATAGWKTFDFAESVFLSAGDYILAVWSDTAGNIKRDADEGVERWWASYTYGSWPDPVSNSDRTGKFSIYATYTPSGGGPAEETTYNAVYFATNF